ncbi:hypothetical protein [Thermaerobacillus caldiproteolyticus]|uniref:Uncharacterized protein n=1 Tax=Thermaerobacillus caldiproteolyticus TaxID=247480 RepID=A0A7V9Z6K6_9BACL|nr:hypothetical protein [Anoxybacillus caldiproteolyticus]MBA2874994.1 hypothetical protein [Anoxybacillus caldiproteolyticus]QPA33020.1 hypothetical protein ISX45_09195 [Anoxybacillus caldiproteolyticus]
MRFRLLCVITGFICGYLMIKWTPNVTPFVFTTFITEFLFNPLRSFLAMVCFLIGFLANAVLIRSLIEGMTHLLRRKQMKWGQWFMSCGVIPSFYSLFQWNTVLTMLFFIFSLIYGIISIDLQRDRRYNQ